MHIVAHAHAARTNHKIDERCIHKLTSKLKWPEEPIEGEGNIEMERKLEVKSKSGKYVGGNFINIGFVVGRKELYTPLPTHPHESTSHLKSSLHCGSSSRNYCLNVPCNRHCDALCNPTQHDGNPTIIFVGYNDLNRWTQKAIDRLVDKFGNSQSHIDRSGKLNLEHSRNCKPNLVNGSHGTVHLFGIHLGHHQTRLAKRIFSIANLFDVRLAISIGIHLVILFAFLDNYEGFVGKRRAGYANGLWVWVWKVGVA